MRGDSPVHGAMAPWRRLPAATNPQAFYTVILRRKPQSARSIVKPPPFSRAARRTFVHAETANVADNRGVEQGSRAMHRLVIAAAVVITAAIILPLRKMPAPALAPAHAEADLSAFDCTDVTQSKLLKRLCYDEARRTLVAEVAGRYYAHCNVDASVLDGLTEAESVPTYYLTEIRAGHKCNAGDLAPEIAKVVAH
jgi:hypothetical protein